MIVLSHFQVAPLLRMGGGQSTASVSPDLGLTTVEAALDDDGVTFPGGEMLTWDDAETIADAETSCFALENGAIRKIQEFSRATNRHCSLMPTSGAPTLLIAGFPMHRIKNIDPHRDTLSKIKAARPAGQVLDTSMGLGYTAIQAAHTSDHVVTLELDPAVVEIARQNPWSRELFANPRIEQRLGDSAEIVPTFADESFSCVIHDPPTMQLAGDLYSGAYYRELYRILKPRGRLFHYIGDLASPSVSRIVPGVVERLGAAGFRDVQRRPEAFGVVARK
ncbi:MAG: methyltransferase domain-containing protein [Anaerolineae bacterium]|nr:methyltransferase domain-containing protein [Anaerolineae bacterium]